MFREVVETAVSGMKGDLFIKKTVLQTGDLRKRSVSVSLYKVGTPPKLVTYSRVISKDKDRGLDELVDKAYERLLQNILRKVVSL